MPTIANPSLQVGHTPETARLVTQARLVEILNHPVPRSQGETLKAPPLVTVTTSLGRQGLGVRQGRIPGKPEPLSLSPDLVQNHIGTRLKWPLLLVIH